MYITYFERANFFPIEFYNVLSREYQWSSFASFNAIFKNISLSDFFLILFLGGGRQFFEKV